MLRDTMSKLEGMSLYSLIFTVILDLLWVPIEGVTVASGFGILIYPLMIGGIFLLGFMIVSAIEYFYTHGDWKSSLVRGAVMGVIAATPFTFIGWLFGVLAGYRPQIKPGNETYLLGRFTEGWRALEATLIRKAQRLGYLKADMDIVDIINFLFDRRLISESEKDELHSLRKFRNMAIHNTTPKEISNIIDRIENIHKRIRNL